ncbi:HAD-IC family P-type ATPase [Lacticaseibacillus sharpeae]|uniref:Cation transport ATPase n=1 Tax=Lacticaseibacillus sharpeae JCM 1186 = DSM 20505 TaxID=1291052 RepID=A0A0R1ZXM5_9LACO|nr:HAD-IC family P-type ATPase [Lacticaseibacillus sharpeae]KRM56617.1 cation transport ATPase [Lacticaseibacillus sharpeae JCM 1186 = DSM 20505]
MDSSESKSGRPDGEQQPAKPPLWQLSSDELAAKFKTNVEDGLNEDDAKARLRQYGPNALVAKKQSKIIRFLKQFNDSINYILAAAAILTFFMHHYSDSAVIALVIIANAFIGYFQEESADNALAKISELLVASNYVYRGGDKLELSSHDLVPGDLVQLEAGDAVPADMRLIEADNLTVQESVLTGEAVSVEKTEDPLTQAEIPLAERTNMVFASTAVTTGSGLGVVVATGANTEIGHIQNSVKTIKPKPTPLVRNLNKLGLQLSLAIVAVAALLFVVGLMTKVYSLSTLTIAVITMVVGSMPEGLPASTSVVLAMGTRKLTKQNAIVKTLPAVETLGAVDIINSDKTGTLTKNEMTVTDIIADGQDFVVDGVGYAADGHVKTSTGKDVDWAKNDKLKWLVTIAGETSDAEFHEEDGQWVLTGEPTDGALTTLYHKLMGVEPDPDEIDSLPFDSQFRYSARLANVDGERVLMVKGAPQTLVRLANEHGGNIDAGYVEKQVAKLANAGKRVVALAWQPVAPDTDEINQDEIGAGLKLAGLVGIIDPPRPEVAAAISELRVAGVRVKMITGDDPRTASAIAKQLNMGETIEAITGPELEKLSDEQLQDQIDRYTVFARATPEDKLRIVRAQQAQGHVVGMTGDGVNDAPALKQADIGIAMGIKGTEVAKGAADMVLADDNFTTILTAVREGRHVFDNIRKTIRYLLPTSFAEGLVVVLSIAFQQPLPLYPTQLLWINMVSALTIQFAFIFEPPEDGIMTRGPRNVNEGILTKWHGVEVAYVAVLIAGLGLAIYDWLFNHGMSHVVGSTVALQIVIFGKIFYLFNLRNSHPVISKYFFQNKMAFWIIGILLLLQCAIIYLPFMNGIFHTTPVGLAVGWGIPTLAGLVVLIITEAVKFTRIGLMRRAGRLSNKI